MKRTISLTSIDLVVKLISPDGTPYYDYEVNVGPIGGEWIGGVKNVPKDNPVAVIPVSSRSEYLQVRFQGHPNFNGETFTFYPPPITCDRTELNVVYAPIGQEERPTEKAELTARVFRRDGSKLHACTEFRFEAIDASGVKGDWARRKDRKTEVTLEVTQYANEDANKQPLHVRIFGGFTQNSDGSHGQPLLGASHSFMIQPITDNTDLDFVFEAASE